MNKTDCLLALLYEPEKILTDFIISNKLNEYLLMNLHESDYAQQSLHFKTALRGLTKRLTTKPNNKALDQFLDSATNNSEFASFITNELSFSTPGLKRVAKKRGSKDSVSKLCSSTKKRKINNWPNPFEFPEYKISADFLVKLQNANKILQESEYKLVINALVAKIRYDLDVLMPETEHYLEATKSFTRKFPHLELAYDSEIDAPGAFEELIHKKLTGKFAEIRRTERNAKKENAPAELIEAQMKFGKVAKAAAKLKLATSVVPAQADNNMNDVSEQL